MRDTTSIAPPPFGFDPFFVIDPGCCQKGLDPGRDRNRLPPVKRVRGAASEDFEPAGREQSVVCWLAQVAAMFLSCSHAGDPRAMRLYDLADDEVIEVRCPCGRIAEYMPGLLQRLYRVPSDVLVYDLQFRLRCQPLQIVAPGSRSPSPTGVHAVIGALIRGSSSL